LSPQSEFLSHVRKIVPIGARGSSTKDCTSSLDPLASPEGFVLQSVPRTSVRGQFFDGF